MPFLALIFVMPKLKKKEKVQKETKTYEELKQEEKQNDTIVEEKPVKEKRVFQTTDFTSEDFQNYLKHKNETTSKPQKIEHNLNFMDNTTDYIPTRRKLKLENKPKNIAEEIKSLSPELKALIISGALDKKNFD